MSPIKILHASDLHIAYYRYHSYRSPLDRLEDIGFRRNWSLSGIWEKLKTPKSFFISWWKKLSASSYEPEVLDVLAEYIYKNAKKRIDTKGDLVHDPGKSLDAVVLTGDLATTGILQDIEQTKRFLFGAPNPGRPYFSLEGDRRGTLSGVRIPVVVLPGNHDRLMPTKNFTWSGIPKFFEPGGDDFDNHLDDYRKDPVKSWELTSPTAEGKILKVLILAADCTLQKFEDYKGKLGWIAQGKVYPNALSELKQKTEGAVKNKKENEILCVIWACHFPPYYPGIKLHSKLLDEKDLIDTANKMPAPVIILAGHTHNQLSYRLPNMRNRVYCCGTTTQFEPSSKTGEKNADNLKKGNLFQIIVIDADAAPGQIKIYAEDYRYQSEGVYGGGRIDANALSWVKISF